MVQCSETSRLTLPPHAMDKQGLKILLVEDDEDDAFFIKDIMADSEVEPRPVIKHVLNPKTALKVLESESFDICLFDYRLGEMDGIDLLRKVRKMGVETPVIFLTGQSDQEIAVEAMKSGATDFRTKSNLTSEALLQSIRFAIQLRKEEDRREFAETRLKKSNDDIQATNEELQKSLQRLREAQNHLLRSEKLASIGRLAAGVCHEILNPLNIISGHVQALKMERESDQDLGEDLYSITEEIDRIEKIVGGLLKFSRKEDMELKHSDINEELESVLSIMEKEMFLDNIQVVRQFDPDLPRIEIDANRMRQVFLNLVNNARYAMECGGVLTVTTEKIYKEQIRNRRKTDADKELEKIEVHQEIFLRIKIADTGTGIKKSDMMKLFDPFFTTKPEDKGTGLGLSICYTIIEKHLGTIEVESEYGKGATFVIELPGPTNSSSEQELL